MIGLDGLSVARAIPKDALLGLINGSYSLHGGVVRDVGGKIVAHLAMPSTMVSAVPGMGWVADAFQTYQLREIGLSLTRVEGQLATVMQLSMATVALSGLNVVVSIAGFAFLARKLSEVNRRLGQIEKATRKIQSTLDAVRYGRLQGAIDGLRHASLATVPATKHALLMQSKQVFGQLVPEYTSLWRSDPSLETIEALDDCYTIAMVGHALSMSELDDTGVAHAEFERDHLAWRRLAQEYCRDSVLRDNPERLLHHKYLAIMPSNALIGLLDFAHGSDRKLAWIDDLRQMEADASILRLPSFASEDSSLQFARKLVAKDAVLQGYSAHFAFLAERGIRASAFEDRVGQLFRDVSGAGPIWICEEPAPVPEELVPIERAAEAVVEEVPWMRRALRWFGWS